MRNNRDYFRIRLVIFYILEISGERLEEHAIYKVSRNGFSTNWRSDRGVNWHCYTGGSNMWRVLVLPKK
jgi:hypothetical protein